MTNAMTQPGFRTARGLCAALLAGALLASVPFTAGCAEGGRGGTGSTSGTSTGTGGTVTPSSPVSAAHWQAAMTALAHAPNPDPVSLDPRSFAAFNDLLARGWTRMIPMGTSALEQALNQQLVGKGAGGVSVLSVHSVVLDAGAAPTLTTPAAGSPVMIVEAPPAPQSWRMAFALEVGGTISTVVFGQWVYLPIRVRLDAAVDGLRIHTPVTLDLANPVEPKLASIGYPTVELKLVISSPDPLVSTITGALTAVLDPVVRTAMTVLGFFAPSMAMPFISQVQAGSANWGKGGPALVGVAGVDLAAHAEEITDEILRHHMPHDAVFPAKFDQPGYGNGQVVDYFDFGDSADWTGFFLAGEAYRYELTQDPAALDAIDRCLRGYGVLLDVAQVGGGLISRCAIPLAAPLVARISGNRSYFTGTSGGVGYGALGHVVRDQFMGVAMGLVQVYLRVPSRRDLSRQYLSRMIAYLERDDWVVHHPNGEPSNPFFQSPMGTMCMTKAAAAVDPQWGGVDARYRDLAHMAWLNEWLSSREVHEQYFKFCLSHCAFVTLFELETDPDMYRAHLRSLRINREVLAHHQNALFDAVWGMAVPTQAAAMAPQVEDALERWTLRPRRGFTALNSQDPTIAKTTYVAAASASQSGGHLSLPSQSAQNRTQEVSLYPIPIEKRPPNDFLWQISPFRLDRSMPAEEQYPGIDLQFPYWFARSHGMLR